MGVFSEYLVEYWSPKSPVKSEHPLKDAIKEMNCKKLTWAAQHDCSIFVCSPLTKGLYFEEGNYIWSVYSHAMFNIIQWVNENIVMCVIDDNIITSNVKMRIATGMLNRAVDKNELNKDYAILAHDILVANIAELRFNLATEQLPF